MIQEAFHFGRPVICSDIGGMAEKVTHGVDGLHFRAMTPASSREPSSTQPRRRASGSTLRSGIRRRLSDGTARRRTRSAVREAAAHSRGRACRLSSGSAPSRNGAFRPTSRTSRPAARSTRAARLTDELLLLVCVVSRLTNEPEGASLLRRWRMEQCPVGVPDVRHPAQRPDRRNADSSSCTWTTPRSSAPRSGHSACARDRRDLVLEPMDLGSKLTSVESLDPA